MKPFLLLLLTLQAATSFTQELDFKWSFSECDASINTFSREVQDRISEYYKIGGKTYVTLGFQESCSFYPEIDIQKNNHTLNIKLSDKNVDDIAMCDCCFSITIEIEGKHKLNKFLLNETSIPITDEVYKTFPIQFEIVRGDTINKRNKYGELIGAWHYPTPQMDSTTNSIFDGFFGPGYDSLYMYFSEPDFPMTMVKIIKPGIYMDYYDDSIGYTVIYGDTINFSTTTDQWHDSTTFKTGLHMNYELNKKDKVEFYKTRIDEISAYDKDAIQIMKIEKKYDTQGYLEKETIYHKGKCFTVSIFEKGRLIKECSCEITPEHREIPKNCTEYK